MKTRLLSILCILLMSIGIQAHDLEPLHVDGRYLKNSKGDIVTLHGYMTVLEPVFQVEEYRWAGFDAAKCLKNKKAATERLLESGWKMDYVRLILDPYWCIDEGKSVWDRDLFKAFDFTRFKRYFEELFLPLIDYYNEMGIYTVLNPPAASGPELIEIGDGFQQHMLLVWNYISSHPRIRNNPGVMFELANEPVNINCLQGENDWEQYLPEAKRSTVYKEGRDYWQPVVDKIRSHCDNIIYIPGFVWQSCFSGFADYPIKGGNIGYAVHSYSRPDLREHWEKQVFPIAYMAPIMITETAWGDSDDSGSTSDFGEPLKQIIDELGNVSWNFLEPREDRYYLVNKPSSDEVAIIANDPQANFLPAYNWWNEYAETKVLPTSQLKAKNVLFDNFPTSLKPGQKVLAGIKAEFTNGMTWDVSGDAEYIISDESVLSIEQGVIWAMKEGKTNVIVKYTDGTGQVFNREFEVTNTLFPLTKEGLVLDWFSLDAGGSFDEATGTFSSGGPGSGGWDFEGGMDFSSYKYLVVQLNHEQHCSATLHIYGDRNLSDENSAWNDEINDIGFPFNDKTELVIDLHSLHKQNGDPMDLSHIYRVEIWINGAEGSVSIKRVFLSNDGTTPAYQEPTRMYADNKVMYYGDEVPDLTYSISGPRIDGTPILSTTANSTSSVGIYPIIMEKGTVTNEQANYIDGTLTVMKAPLMVGVEDVTINEGDAIPTTFTLTYDGWRNNDNESNALTSKPIISTTATSSSLPGTYPITISGGEGTNYYFYGQGTLTIKEMGTWSNLVLNSDMEDNDVSCFYKWENYAESETLVSATIGSHSGIGSSRGIAVKSVDNPAASWNTQFFVRLPQTIPAGTKYRMSFDYKASQEAYVRMEIHAEPGEYIYWDFDHIRFTPSWQHHESEGTITEELSTDENKMRTIAFDLAFEKTATTYYFDNIVFEIYYPKGKEPIVLGDLNDDRSVSITDVVLIVDVIAGSITDAKKVKAADVNKDGSVTITDCVAAIDLIAAQSKSVRMNRASQKLISSDYISAFMKDNLLTVNLDNENRYTAFQMVVTMPDGMTIDKAAIDELRGTDHQLTVRNLGNGQYLLAGFSMGNSELAGNSGRLLTIGTKGQTKGDIIISDIEFATAEAEAYRLVPITISNAATGIYQIENREWKRDDAIFDLQGRQVNQPTHGLYIKNGKLIIVKQKK